MSWSIERRGRVAVVTMMTNRVNAQNRAFFADLHDALDRLERDHADSPVVLTGNGPGSPLALISTSISLCSPAIRPPSDRGSGLPRNEHAPVHLPAAHRRRRERSRFAGGLITAAVCDHRIAVTDGANFGLNEVPIGIPMPAVYVRMLAYAWGEPVAARTWLLGETFTPAQAHELGMVHELVSHDLLDRAVAIAEQTPEDCLEHYAFTKRACQAAALRDIADLADPLDTELPERMTSEQAQHAHRRYWQQFKGRPADW